MKKFLLTVLGIAIYVLVGWLIKDIVFANYANPLDTPVVNIEARGIDLLYSRSGLCIYYTMFHIFKRQQRDWDVLTYWIVRCCLFLIDIIIYIDRTHHCI